MQRKIKGLFLVALVVATSFVAQAEPVAWVKHESVMHQSKVVAQEMRQSVRTAKIARYGSLAAVGSGLAYLAYKNFSAKPEVLVKHPKTQKEMVKALCDKFIGREENPDANPGMLKKFAGGALSMGKDFAGLAFIMISGFAINHLLQKYMSLLNATQPYSSFEAFVAQENFASLCDALKKRAEELKHAPMMVGDRELAGFIHMYNIHSVKLVRLCAYLVNRADDMEGVSTHSQVSQQLRNQIATICDRSRKNAQQLEQIVSGQLSTVAASIRVEQAATLVSEFVDLANSLVNQAKHVEIMAMAR
jgi:hypothetical protein